MYPSIKRSAFVSRDGVSDLRYGNILEKHFTSMIIGRPDSGKSTLIEDLLTNEDLYFQKFDHIYIVSPSDFKKLKVAKENSNHKYDLMWIAQKIQEAADDISRRPQTERYNVLFVFDDVITEIKRHDRQDFQQQLFYNRRNMIPNTTISLLLTTQKFNLLPAKLRSVLSSLYIFNLSNTDFKIACNDLPFVDKQEIREICNQAFRQKHTFVYIRMQPFMVCINFKPQVLKKDLSDLVNNIKQATNMDNSNTLSSAMQNIITRHAPAIKLNQSQVSNILPQDPEEASDSEKVSQPQPSRQLQQSHPSAQRGASQAPQNEQRVIDRSFLRQHLGSGFRH